MLRACRPTRVGDQVESGRTYRRPDWPPCVHAVEFSKTVAALVRGLPSLRNSFPRSAPEGVRERAVDDSASGKFPGGRVHSQAGRRLAALMGRGGGA